MNGEPALLLIGTVPNGNMTMKPLAITLGDPAGIGAEVVFKALQSIDIPVILFGNRRLASESLESCNMRDAIGRYDSRFIDVGMAGGNRLREGQIDAEYGRVALASIDAAIDAVNRGLCSALMTAPIHKQSIVAAGSDFPGHTELLAARAGLSSYGHDYAMYFDSPTLRVVLLSVHLSLREAIAAIHRDRVAALARLTHREFGKLFGRPPSIAVAGVNPHAGEAGLFGDEELEIAAGVELAADEGIEISGPHSPDTVFLSASRGRYDVVLAMYHDQGLIPIKTLYFEESVNVTLGLPYLRCSVDHGTAFDIAGKGIANPAPTEYAIRWAAARVSGGAG